MIHLEKTFGILACIYAITGKINFDAQFHNFKFRIVIWHIFGRMEKLSEINLPLTKNGLYEEAGNFKFKKKSSQNK
jgi:hypothetical protein